MEGGREEGGKMREGGGREDEEWRMREEEKMRKDEEGRKGEERERGREEEKGGARSSRQPHSLLHHATCTALHKLNSPSLQSPSCLLPAGSPGLGLGRTPGWSCHTAPL